MSSSIVVAKVKLEGYKCERLAMFGFRANMARKKILSYAQNARALIGTDLGKVIGNENR